jgi:hypothetical protein
METLNSSETSVLTTASRRNIPEDGILHSNKVNSIRRMPYSALLPRKFSEDYIVLSYGRENLNPI